LSPLSLSLSLLRRSLSASSVQADILLVLPDSKLIQSGSLRNNNMNPPVFPSLMFSEFVFRLGCHRAPRPRRQTIFAVARAKIATWSQRVVTGSAAFDLSRNSPGLGDAASPDARAWIPNNLICRDPGAISCLLGHVSVRYSLRVSVRDQRASRSFLSLFPSSSAAGEPTSWMIAGDRR